MDDRHAWVDGNSSFQFSPLCFVVAQKNDSFCLEDLFCFCFCFVWSCHVPDSIETLLSPQYPKVDATITSLLYSNYITTLSSNDQTGDCVAGFLNDNTLTRSSCHKWPVVQINVSHCRASSHPFIQQNFSHVINIIRQILKSQFVLQERLLTFWDW